MLVHYKRKYTVQNPLKNKPVSIMHDMITTDQKMTWKQLNVVIHDGNGSRLSLVNLKDDEYHKVFDFALPEPLLPGETQEYFVEYDLEEPERYFENTFFAGWGECVTQIDFPLSKGIKVPIAYEIPPGAKRKIKSKLQPDLTKTTSDRATYRWSIAGGRKGHVYGFCW